MRVRARLAFVLASLLGACTGAADPETPSPRPVAPEAPRATCEAGGYWVETQADRMAGRAFFSELRWFCDSVIVRYAEEGFPPRFCTTRDHAYRLRSWQESGAIMVDMTPFGLRPFQLGRLEGGRLLASATNGGEREMEWLPSDTKRPALSESLRDATRGFYPDVPECGGIGLFPEPEQDDFPGPESER